MAAHIIRSGGILLALCALSASGCATFESGDPSHAVSTPSASETNVGAPPTDAAETQEPTDDDAPAEGSARKPATASPDRAELERKFQETMSGAVLDGQWRLVRDGKLGDERMERYTLGEVRKLEGDQWIIEARIQYGTKDVTIPVPVFVYWANDTPVISVTKAWLPGLGQYTARVAVYEGQYAGMWSGPNYGGIMSGVVRPAAEGETREDDATNGGGAEGDSNSDAPDRESVNGNERG